MQTPALPVESELDTEPASWGGSLGERDLLSADVGRDFRAISAPGQGAADSGSLGRFEFDQVQGLSLPSPQ
jgi:hypothetical protein